jgi:YD repeat-containing protein
MRATVRDFTMRAFTRVLLVSAFAAAITGPRAANAAESYQYDTMSRLTDVAYGNGSSIHYTYDANGNILSVVTSLATAVEPGASPLRFALGPSTPNPSPGPRNIVFSTPTRGHVTLRVFDAAGRERATLFDRVIDAGSYQARFSATGWASGVYFYRLSLDGRVLNGRMVVVR